MSWPNYNVVATFVIAWLFPGSTILTTFSINKPFSLNVFPLQFSLPAIAAKGKQHSLESLPVIGSNWTIKLLS